MHCDGVSNRVAQADGTFTLDGKHGGWQSLAEVLSHAKDQAATTHLARMVAVIPGDGVPSIHLLPGTLMGTGLVAAAAEENGYALLHLNQPTIYDSNDSNDRGDQPVGGEGIHASTLAGFDDEDMDL